jgi:hypothetical protein
MDAELLEEAYRVLRSATGFLRGLEWRVGRSQPCNVYARCGGDDWKADFEIAVFKTPELAEQAVRDHNANCSASWH